MPKRQTQQISIRHLQWTKVHHLSKDPGYHFIEVLSINQSEQAEEQKKQIPAPHDTSAVDVYPSQAPLLLVPFFPPSIPIPPSPGRGGALGLPYLHVVPSLPFQAGEIDVV